MYRKILLTLCAVIALSALAGSRKSVSILGDSYSTYEGFLYPSGNAIWYFAQPQRDLTDVDDVKQTWWHMFIKDNGYTLDKNNSFSGSTVCNTGYHGNDYSDRSFITRMDDLGSPDMIIIFGATNDSWANSPLGEMKYEGWTTDELKQFRPALCYMLSHITDRYINTEVVYLINDGLKPEITDAIRQACDHYGVKYVDLHNISKTAGHPNRAGMEQIARQLNEALSTNSTHLAD